MPKVITQTQNLAQQARQIAGETFETIKKQPSEMAGIALEQLGVKQALDVEAKAKIEQLKAQDTAKSRQQILQLEREMAELRRARQEQLRQRRQAAQTAGPAKPESPPAVQGKRPRGLLGFWGKRIKSAQQQARPETVGKRVGG